MAAEKTVGGLGCFDVLEHLSDYVDGELDAALRQRVEAHLAGCDECTRFGGEFGAVVTALRQRLGAADDVPKGTAERLARALERAGGKGR